MYGQTIRNIDRNELADAVLKMKGMNYRLTAITCLKTQGSYELIYSFDRDYELDNLRIVIYDPETELTSISGIYWSAFIYENEINDLYGLNITNINIDFKGSFIKTAEKAAFSKGNEGEVKANG